MRLRTICALALVGLAGAVSSGQQPPRPRLILVLSIDQMRFDYLTRFQKLYTGGLKTLTEGGAIFSNAMYRHAANETGPGHSVILSGMHPSHSGIIANEWWDSFRRTIVNVVDDPVQGTLGGTGRAASPANFIGFTVGDVLKHSSPSSRVVGISSKDRSAILMAGKRADAAYWFENAGGNFVTSTYYMSSPPAWLTAFNARHIVDRYAGRSWNRLLDDPALYEKLAGPDWVNAEADGKDLVFPHTLPAAGDTLSARVRQMPFIDEVVLEAALAAMAGHTIGRDEATDILAIGLSATDGVGHRYGPDSQEAMDQLLRLDRLLGDLLKTIGETVGMDGTLIVLTADHGVVPLVEQLAAHGEDARRIAPATLLAAVNKALAARFPGVDGIVSYFAGDVYFDPLVLQKNKIRRADVERTVRDALLKTGTIAEVYLREDLLDDAPPRDPYIALFRNSFFDSRSPDANILLKPRYYLSGQAGGTGHVTPYEYDRHVPVIFYGAGIKAGWYGNEAGPEDIAPTLARILGLSMPKEPDSRILSEALE
jgi:predicted AlkP superfamily pyrophosphatase or phosphodiesterase